MDIRPVGVMFLVIVYGFGCGVYTIWAIASACAVCGMYNKKPRWPLPGCYNPTHDSSDASFFFSVKPTSSNIFLHARDVMTCHEMALIAPAGNPGIANMRENGHSREAGS